MHPHTTGNTASTSYSGTKSLTAPSSIPVPPPASWSSWPTPLGEVGQAYVLDPIRDLRPVSPNCHAMLHQRHPALEIEQLKETSTNSASEIKGRNAGAISRKIHLHGLGHVSWLPIQPKFTNFALGAMGRFRGRRFLAPWILKRGFAICL
jgi:hypothetical protein